MTDIRRPTRRLLHTSDLHLESLEHHSCRYFTQLIIAARLTKADLVIIAGDLFDSQRVKDDLINYVVEELRSLPAPVVILPGNHDCLTPASAYGRSQIWDHCPNIKIFRSPEGETLKLTDMGFTLWGKASTSYEKEIAPLADIPRPEDDGSWKVAVAHGLYIGNIEPYGTGYQISRREIVESGWDYVALGHVPVFDVICSKPVVACYSGSPGASGGFFLIVDFREETGITLSRYAAQYGTSRIS
ncbi:MAG: DNA repair exonuclease [Deltaproteobacteria bacterium]|nr:DNA repair exonuclease [Deltaproteobacteria bacterium]